MEIYSRIAMVIKKNDSIANSIQITKYPANRLGFEGWFEWNDFEDIPAGYEDAITY